MPSPPFADNQKKETLNIHSMSAPYPPGWRTVVDQELAHFRQQLLHGQAVRGPAAAAAAHGRRSVHGADTDPPAPSFVPSHTLHTPLPTLAYPQPYPRLPATYPRRTRNVPAQDPAMRPHYLRYASDASAFFREYAAAHKKLSELGSAFFPAGGIRI